MRYALLVLVLSPLVWFAVLLCRLQKQQRINSGLQQQSESILFS
ncbi:hypothetical protein YPPY72_2728 [Yersinia pestis PY-72]|nr:conserved hypothetical protein [Yersinia pestis biovar Antiqua str. UG05-0454]EIQ89208.1 hypothetical protein YPPY02_2668 [Yersinia pestis PY-02]EIR32824.1 hypothetical protein YPPY11_2813 [Yersinia pestis PY-11]EIR64445.1 hypothetical protein YPPY25_2712 [Yersinia pestis PY-25]EIS78594.1 hypothetical protein YPPY72_2728 [Yersinia pestis PY-72]EIT58254.1 hypothetical protein YPPY103_2828 [Yersinia pestis PY-103]